MPILAFSSAVRYTISTSLVLTCMSMFQKPSHETHPPASLHGQEHDDVETVVGPSVHVEGDFASEGNMLIKGVGSGSVRTSKLLTAESGSKIMANVRAGSAVISGAVRGNVKVEDRLEVTASAQVAGDIECNTLVVEAGAKIHGKVSMKGLEMDLPKPEKKSGLLMRKPKVEGEENAE